MPLGLFLILAIAMELGCVDSPKSNERWTRATNIDQDLTNLDQSLVSGSAFHHLVYRQERRAGDPSVLHVYIEGDGQAFLTPTKVAARPQSRNPLMLHLMLLDPAPSLYLGRPCYFGLESDPPCGPVYWTTRRFAPEVVESMAAALRTEASRVKASSIELYGHSGGGTLAILLATRVMGVRRVVTIGPTLDTDAWCSLHGYSPLLESLNPVESPFPTERVRVLHLVGSDDTNTPPSFVEAAAARAGMIGSVRVIPGFTHNCCWQEIWNAVLQESL